MTETSNCLYEFFGSQRIFLEGTASMFLLVVVVVDYRVDHGGFICLIGCAYRRVGLPFPRQPPHSHRLWLPFRHPWLLCSVWSR